MKKIVLLPWYGQEEEDKQKLLAEADKWAVARGAKPVSLSEKEMWRYLDFLEAASFCFRASRPKSWRKYLRGWLYEVEVEESSQAQKLVEEWMEKRSADELKMDPSSSSRCVFSLPRSYYLYVWQEK